VWKYPPSFAFAVTVPQPLSSESCSLTIRRPSTTAAQLAASYGVCAAAISSARRPRHSVPSLIILTSLTARTPGPSKKPLVRSWMPLHSRGHYHDTASRHIFSGLVRWSRKARHASRSAPVSQCRSISSPPNSMTRKLKAIEADLWLQIHHSAPRLCDPRLPGRVGLRGCDPRRQRRLEEMRCRAR
jgi:hypothetical protein